MQHLFMFDSLDLFVTGQDARIYAEPNTYVCFDQHNFFLYRITWRDFLNYNITLPNCLQIVACICISSLRMLQIYREK